MRTSCAMTGASWLAAVSLACSPKPPLPTVAPDDPAPPPGATSADQGSDPAASPELDHATLAAMAREVATLNELVHPGYGMFFIHNIAGPVRQIEVADGWPDIESDDDIAWARAIHPRGCVM